MEDEHPPRPKGKRKDRRKAILSAAARVFAEKGYHRTTTKEIAESAAVAEGTIYNYFNSKDDLLVGMVTHLKDEQNLSGRLGALQPADARTMFAAVMAYRQQFVVDNYDMLKAVMTELLVNDQLRSRYYDEVLAPVMEQFEHQLAERVALGQLEIADVPLATRVLIGSLFGMFFLHALGDPVLQEKWQAVPEEMVNLFFEGMESGEIPNVKY